MTKFTVEIEIADVWIEDGLTFIDPDALRDALNNLLFAGYAEDEEIGIKVKNPSEAAIKRAISRAERAHSEAA